MNALILHCPLLTLYTREEGRVLCADFGAWSNGGLWLLRGLTPAPMVNMTRISLTGVTLGIGRTALIRRHRFPDRSAPAWDTYSLVSYDGGWELMVALQTNGGALTATEAYATLYHGSGQREIIPLSDYQLRGE